MKNTRRSGMVRTVAAFGLGATLGSVIALLYAPASGKMTRKRLALKVRTFRKTAARQFGQTTRVLTTKAEQVRDAAAGWITDHIPHSNGGQAIRHRRIRHAEAR